MKDTLEQLAAEVTAANDDLNLGNHDNDLQRLRELESDREDLIERINAREDRFQVARDALLHFVAPEAQPEPNATVEPPEAGSGIQCRVPPDGSSRRMDARDARNAR